MSTRKARSVLFLAGCSVLVSALTGTDAVAADPCDLLPTSAPKVIETVKVTSSLCNVNCAAPAGVSLPSAPFMPPMTLAPNAKFDYFDQWHGACQLSVGPAKSCYLETTCAPGETRFADAGVWKCKGVKLDTVMFNPRLECKNSVPAPPLAVEAGPYTATREKAILSQAGKPLCTVGGGGWFYVKGANLHLVDAVKVNDPQITLAVYSDAEHLNAVKVIVKQLGPSVRLGEHQLELSALNGRTKVTAKITVQESTATLCPPRRDASQPSTVRHCSTGDASCSGNGGSRLGR